MRWTYWHLQRTAIGFRERSFSRAKLALVRRVHGSHLPSSAKRGTLAFMPNLVPRPTGRSLSEYPGYPEWTFQRWAWEFLRRNPEFQQACRDAGEDSAKRIAVAEQFGLRRFERFQYEKKRPNWAPKFSAASVSKWSWLKNQKKPLPLSFDAGDVVLRFRLAETALEPAALTAQLADAKQFLLQRRAEYLQDMQVEPGEVITAAKPVYFLRNLRLLDLLDGKGAARCTAGRALRLLHEKRGTQMSEAEALERYREQINQARALAKSGYRLLAIREGIPRPPKFETADIDHPVLR